MTDYVQFEKGDLLVASKGLLDPNFQETIVLLCENKAEGSYGLVLNRSLSVSPIALEELPFVQGNLFRGGPVQPEVLQILHPYGPDLGHSFEIVPGIWIGGDFEIMKSAFAIGSMDPSRCRFFLGYSGWGEDQLASEFAVDSWITVRANTKLVFETPAEKMWLEAVRERGRSDPLYSNFPENPSLN